MLDRRTLRAWAYVGAGGLGVWAIATVALLLFGPIDPTDPMRIVLMTGAVVLAMAWAFALGTRSFHKADEFAQQGSRVAWYWGGSLGLAVSGPVFVFMTFGGLHWLGWTAAVHWLGWTAVQGQTVNDGKALSRTFAFGYMLPVLLQVIGFLVARAWWRISKR